MYDKVTLVIPRTKETPNIEQQLSKGKQQIDIETGEVQTLGSFHGVQIGIYTSCIRINGSLSHLLYPNNIYPLDIHSTKDAIEMLSDSLHIDTAEAKVTYLEYGTQFVMSKPINAYIPLLAEMPRLKRISVNDESLYYRQTAKRPTKEFIFYDKIADAKAKGMQIPTGLEGTNLLKYEMRLKGRLSQQLMIPEVKASTLYKRAFYKLLMERYQSSYISIDKKKKLKSKVMNDIKTVTDALEVLVARLINQSNPDEISGFIEDLKQAKVFKDPKYYTRLRNKVKEIAKKGGTTVSDDLIEELDEAIRNVGFYV